MNQLPLITAALDHIAEHYGLTAAEARALVRTPTHPHSMRDEFAAAALTGLMAANQPLNRAEMAAEAYAQAEAMLAARLSKDPS